MPAGESESHHIYTNLIYPFFKKNFWLCIIYYGLDVMLLVLFRFFFFCREAMFSLHVLPKIATSRNSQKSHTTQIWFWKAIQFPLSSLPLFYWVMQYGCFSFSFKPLRQSVVCSVCVYMHAYIFIVELLRNQPWFQDGVLCFYTEILCFVRFPKATPNKCLKASQS